VPVHGAHPHHNGKPGLHGQLPAAFGPCRAQNPGLPNKRPDDSLRTIGHGHVHVYGTENSGTGPSALSQNS
jgi:hypothetical protein